MAGRVQFEPRNRQPVNDPAEEDLSKLTKGAFWHNSSDLACCCKTADCGAKQEVPFCQGCGQHHHRRDFCYKKEDSRYNATGYWSDNRKGQPPIQSLGGSYPGSPNKSQFPRNDRNAVTFSQDQPRIPPPAAAKFNMTDAGGGQ